MPPTQPNNDQWLAGQLAQLKRDVAALKARTATLASVTTGLFLPARAYRTAAFTTTLNTAVELPIDTLDYDTSGGNMDVVTNHRFNIPANGYYEVNYQVIINPGVANTNELGIGLIFKNGSEYSTGSRAAQTDDQGFLSSVGSDILEFAAGDHVQLYVYASGAWGLYVGAPHDYNFLSIMRVA